MFRASNILYFCLLFQVEGTNDSSCLSKCSAAERGYFSDEFLKFFVNKCPRRAPLINMGYSVRAAIINNLIEDFVNTNNSLKQVSLKKCLHSI